MKDDHGRPADADGRQSPGATADGRRVVSAEVLFGPRQELEIHHGRSIYRLRMTKSGKLILTK